MTDSLNALQLQRWPHYKKENLLAYDAADALIIEQFKDHSNKRLLIVNDNFGAISLALANSNSIQWVNDSYLSEIALDKNLIENPHIDSGNISAWLPEQQLEADNIIVRIPKTMALLKNQLHLIAQRLTNDTPILLAGMFKHLPRNLQLNLQEITQLQRSQITKKAQFYTGFLRPQDQDQAKSNHHYSLLDENLPQAVKDLKFSNPATVFSSQQLDIGSRFLLQNLPSQACSKVADLGCGNGVLGLSFAVLHPRAEVDFFDQSKAAIACCKDNVLYNHKENNLDHRFSYYVADGFDTKAATSLAQYELILCNPPFHQGHNVTQLLAIRLFEQSKKQLKAGGKLLVVANRHLPYKPLLQRIFGDCQQLAGNQKFNIYCASHK